MNREASLLLWLVTACLAPPAFCGTVAPALDELLSGRSLVLATAGKPVATIAYGAQTKDAAAKLQNELQVARKPRFPMVSHEVVVQKDKFDYREPWRQRALILVGNVDDNRAFLALYARFLVGVNSGYPGPGRYVVRTLIEPLHAGADMLVVGGSDGVGLEAGVKRAASLLASATNERGDCALRPVIEVGNVDGPVAPNFSAPWRGLDGLYWGANRKAGLGAKQGFLKQLTGGSRDLKRWSGSHYTWEARYRELLKMLAAGFFDAKQVIDIQNRLYENLVNTDDAWGKRALTVPPAEWNQRMTRHTLTGFTGQLLLADYLHHVAKLDATRRQTVAKCYQNLRGILAEIARSRRYRSGIEGREAMDVQGNLANVLFYLGDEKVLRSDLYRTMAAYRLATRDNLGCHAGVDSYIGSRPGHQFNPAPAAGPAAHLGAWLLRDPELLGITKLDKSPGPVTYLGVRFPPKFASPAAGLQQSYPMSFLDLQVLPLDGYFQTLAASFPTESESFVYDAETGGRAFDKAVFRDSLDQQDAYLLLQGLNVSAPMYREGIFGNAIIRYTELGSLFLFSNTQHVGSWARSIVRISRGEHDPQSSTCSETASLREGEIPAVQSVQRQNGGASWRRTIFRRCYGYFVFIDEIDASHDDDYNISCQWRSYHHGTLADERRFVAADMMKGTHMHIVAARPYRMGLVQRERDGAADPLMVRQFQDRAMKKGELLSFLNLVYATGPDAPRSLDIRAIDACTAIVKGKIEGREELTLVGTRHCDDVAGLSVRAQIIHVSAARLHAVAATRVKWPDTALESQVPFNLSLGPAAFTIENPSDTKLSVSFTRAGQRSMLSWPSRKLTLMNHGNFPNKESLKACLEKLWQQAELPSLRRPAAPDRGAPASPKTTEVPQAKPVWQQDVFQIPPRPYHGFGLEVESPTPVDAKVLVDRDHHRWSQRVNFPGSGDWKLKIQLAEPVDVESVRLVGYRSGKLFPEGLKFDLSIEGEGGPRAIPDVVPIGEFWYSECEKYLQTAPHPTLRVPVNARCSRIILSAQKNEGSRARYAFQEVRVFVNDPQWRAKCALHRIHEKGQDALVAIGPDSVVRLDASGKTVWKWKADSGIVHHFVEFSKVENRWLIGVWPVSQRFTVLGADGRVLLAPSAFETKENARLLNGHARPHAVTIWERDAGQPASIAFFPHYSFGEVRRSGDGVTVQIGGGRGGKAVLRIPDITGDGREDLFVVGRYENNNGLLPSQREGVEEPAALAGQHWTGNRVSNWTGWSAGNMELTMYHGASNVWKRTKDGREWLGVIAVNPGGLNFYKQPTFEQAWHHFNHPGNRCHTVGDVTGDGIDEILVGREDGFLVIYDALTGKQLSKINVHGEARAVVTTSRCIAAGTDRRLSLYSEGRQPLAELDGAVESLTRVTSADGLTNVVAAFSDGSIKSFRLP